MADHIRLSISLTYSQMGPFLSGRGVGNLFLIHHLHQSSHMSSVLCECTLVYVTMVTGIHCLYSVNGRVDHVPIYKRGHYYGPVVEHCVALISQEKGLLLVKEQH